MLYSSHHFGYFGGDGSTTRLQLHRRGATRRKRWSDCFVDCPLPLLPEGAGRLLFCVLFSPPSADETSTVGFLRSSVGVRVEDDEEDEEKEEEEGTRRRPLPAEQVASAQSHEVDLAGAAGPHRGEEHLKRRDRDCTELAKTKSQILFTGFQVSVSPQTMWGRETSAISDSQLRLHHWDKPHS